MLQYFNTDWRELTARIPELAEIGYSSLWVPPPTKGSGGLSVGYDLWDRFDLGTKDQRGSVRTRYGSEADLQLLIETAHRFGVRVYFDNIVNHNAFDIPGFNSTTPLDLYPGFVPQDFHLRVTDDGFYRKWDNTRDYNDAWQVQNLGLSDLIDIAHETPNTNFGRNEGDDAPKLTFVRHPGNPEYYLDTDLPIAVSNAGGPFNVATFANKEPWVDLGVPGSAGSAGNDRFDWVDGNANGQHDPGELSESFADTGIDPSNPLRQTTSWGFGDGKYNMGNPVPEDVNALLIRSGRWLLDRTHADGFRLDAVKHVPDYFFGQQSGGDRDKSSAGYIGQAQEQFNLTRGFSDWDNHRDSVFNTEQGRDDAMMFGEHLGQPPGYGGYLDAGMRLVDNDLRNQLNDRLGNPNNGLVGFDQPGAGGFPAEQGVTHAQSHDSDFAARRELQHAFYMTRAGLPLIYTDGNNHAGILGGSGGAFPRISNTNFLGQYGDNRIPNLIYIHNQFARGFQKPRFSDSDFVAYERIDKRENGGMSDGDGVTMLFMMNDNFASGQARSFGTSFPAQGGTSNDSYLFNYSSVNGGFYTYASNLTAIVVPPGGYFAFSWRSPEEPNVFVGSEVKPITILQNGQPVSTVAHVRRDGRDGDPGFNPLGLPDADPGDYRYTIQVPRVTDGRNLSFVARTDGSAENILMQLDGGVDVNSHLGLGPVGSNQDKRDFPPAISTDTFLGYEQMMFVRRTAEKFAAETQTRNVIGSPGAETWQATIGGANEFTINQGAGTNSNAGTAAFARHNPRNNRDGVSSAPQFTPLPAAAAGQPITIRVKTGLQFQISQVYLYYTIDGTTFPEGSGGVVRGATRVVAMVFESSGTDESGGATDWWTGVIPAQPSGTLLRYKVGAFSNDAPSVFPSNAAAVDLKKRMETVFQVTGFDATTAKYRPHHDYGAERTGLAEGFHMVRTRAFLNRAGRASIYNTWAQTFYYDAQTPQGQISFPASDGETIGSAQYGVVVRADPSVTEVWYQIADSDSGNDDVSTGGMNGNGLNAAGLPAWVKANEVSAANCPTGASGSEWRFSYHNVPPSGTATIRVRLLEISSSSDLSVSPNAGHATELTRTVETRGQDVRISVVFPQADGQVVGAGYVMKVRFPAALADGTTEPELRDRFSVRIASSESGSAANAILQPAQALPILYNTALGFHDFQFALPNLYNGVDEFLHTIDVRAARPGNSSLLAARQVRAERAANTPYVNIVNPPQFTSDGAAYQLFISTVANPTPEQRQTIIQVETGQEATGVAIVFTGNASSATLVTDGSPNPTISGNRKIWRFLWNNLARGQYTFSANVDTNNDPSTIEASEARSTMVVFRHSDVPNAAADGDGDGITNGEEFVWGSSPDVSDVAAAQLTITPGPNGQFTLRFDAARERTYQLSFTDDLAEAFVPIAPDFAGNGQAITWTDDGSATGGIATGQRFYRLEVRVPE